MPHLGNRITVRQLASSRHSAFAVALFLAGGAVLYAPVVAKLAVQWWADADASHGLICAPLACSLAYSRRAALRLAAPAPRNAGFALVTVSLLILILGRLGAELFLTRLSLLGVIGGTVLFVLGSAHVRILGLPLLLLLLSIPLPALLVAPVTLPLQLIASASAETALNMAHIAVLRDGNVIVLPNSTLQVADACSGIRSLVALGALSLLVAQSAAHRPWTRALIVFLAAPAAVAMNAVRVTATAAATYWYGPTLAHGIAHEVFGLATFGVAAALVATSAWLITKLWPAPTSSESLQ